MEEIKHARICRLDCESRIVEKYDKKIDEVWELALERSNKVKHQTNDELDQILQERADEFKQIKRDVALRVLRYKKNARRYTNRQTLIDIREDGLVRYDDLHARFTEKADAFKLRTNEMFEELQNQAKEETRLLRRQMEKDISTLRRMAEEERQKIDRIVHDAELKLFFMHI